jgi:hypothetical protein
MTFHKNIHIWLPEHVKCLLSNKEKADPSKPIHIYFTIADHFEPGCFPNYDRGVNRVKVWCKKYPEIARRHCDSDGNHPRHNFFYPPELYKPEFLDMLARLCSDGFGEVEIHIHHDNDTSENLRKTLSEFKHLLIERHGLLRKDETGQIVYGFIHGNWALDNSRKHGHHCGVNNELQILKETGCYADFTLPSAPSEAQTRKINSIYYATDDPDKPKSHDWGIDVEVGRPPSGDLMIIQGPLALNWKNRKYGFFPRIENGEISGYGYSPPIPDIVDLWIKQHIHVKGAPNHVFIKLYAHGGKEINDSVLLNTPLDDMFSYLEAKYNDGEKYRLHYVSAYAMYEKIKELEKNGQVNRS